MSNIKTGQPCPKMAKIEEFKTSLRQGAIKIGAPLEITQTAYGDNGAFITIDSASQSGEKFRITIDWYGGNADAEAIFEHLKIKTFHRRLEEVLDFARNKAFDLAMSLSIRDLILGPFECSGVDWEEDPEDEDIFEVTSYRFTAEQFQEELKAWGIQSEVIDGELWLKNKDRVVASMAATDLDKRLQIEEEE